MSFVVSSIAGQPDSNSFSTVLNPLEEVSINHSYVLNSPQHPPDSDVPSSKETNKTPVHNNDVNILKVLIEGGMSALMLVLLLRVLPETLKYIRQIQQDAREEIQRNTEANKETLEGLVKEFKSVIDDLLKKFEEQESRWFALISQRGYCPIRDNLITSVNPSNNITNK